MFRGTTPTLKIKVKNNIDLNQMKDIWVTVENLLNEITYKMTDGKIIIEEVPTEIGLDRFIVVKMSQEDTLSFTPGEVKIQVRLIDAYDTAYASSIVKEKINPILKEGVINV